MQVYAGISIVEKWRLYDRIKAAERSANTGDSSLLKKQFAVMMPDPFVDELFSEHINVVKSAYGSKQAIKDRISEVVYMLDEIFKMYPTSYQKPGSEHLRKWL